MSSSAVRTASDSPMRIRRFRSGPSSSPIGCDPGASFGELPADAIERLVADRILLPILVVEVPPLARIRGESDFLHRVAKHGAAPALQRRATRIVRQRAIRALVVRAR